VKALVRAGAYIDAKDELGRTPMDIAAQNSADKGVLQSLKFPVFYYCIAVSLWILLVVGIVYLSLLALICFPVILLLNGRSSRQAQREADEQGPQQSVQTDSRTATGNPRTMRGTFIKVFRTWFPAVERRAGIGLVVHQRLPPPARPIQPVTARRSLFSSLSGNIERSEVRR
jgi:hypothetical protein